MSRTAQTVLILTAAGLVIMSRAHAADVSYDGMVDGAGKNVLIDYGTPGGGHNGIGYSFVGTQPWTNLNGGNAFDTATESVLRLGSFSGTPKRSYPAFLNADPDNYTELVNSVTPSTDAVRVSQGALSGGANRGFYRFRYGIFHDPATYDPVSGDPLTYRVQSLILVNDTLHSQSLGYFGNADGSWDLLDFHVNGAEAPPDDFLWGVITDNGNQDNDAPDSLRLRQIAAGAGGSIGTDPGLITMTNVNVGIRQAADYLAGNDTLPNETDIYWFRIKNAVLGDVFTLSGTNNNTNVPIANAFVWALPAPDVPGDYNGNGTVDAADYVVWRAAQADGATMLDNRDPSQMGNPVGAADYDYWRARFGNPPGSAAGAAHSAAVPEATSWLLTTIAAMVVLAARRRQHERR